ncbi:MAG: hypothetical protein OXH38_07380, partial [Chloroflexi bacterium]|nr:hypothetical protein [Chloroflexota bacterium]
MVRLDDLHPEEAQHMRGMGQRFARMPLAETPFAAPPPLAEATIALSTSAGLLRRDDRPFRFGAMGDRILPD